MTNKAKIKGSQFERDATEILNKGIKGGSFRRIPGSGMLGTVLREPLLISDIAGEIKSFTKKFKIEAKVGYNNSSDAGAKQFTLKKLWLDKVAEEAKSSYAIPMLIGKFLGAREGVKVFVVLDVEVFAELMNRATELYEENEKLTIAGMGRS